MSNNAILQLVMQLNITITQRLQNINLLFLTCLKLFTNFGLCINKGRYIYFTTSGYLSNWDVLNVRLASNTPLKNVTIDRG